MVSFRGLVISDIKLNGFRKRFLKVYCKKGRERQKSLFETLIKSIYYEGGEREIIQYPPPKKGLINRSVVCWILMF